MIFGLVEVPAGLVVGEEIDLESDVSLVVPGTKFVAEEGLRPPRELLEVTGGAVVAGHDGARSRQLDEEARQLLAARLRPLGEMLDGSHSVVEVREVPREQVRLAVHEAERDAAREHGAAPLVRDAQARGEQLLVQRGVLPREHPQRDRALGRPEPTGDEVAASVGEAHFAPGDEPVRGTGDVRAKDPRMPGARPLRSLLRHRDCGRKHGRVRSLAQGAVPPHGLICCG